jgi:hypothetical protein
MGLAMNIQHHTVSCHYFTALCTINDSRLVAKLQANYVSEMIFSVFSYTGWHAVAQWLRHCVTNRKIAGSIPDGVTGFFH